MDNAPCHVVYLDQSISKDYVVTKDDEQNLGAITLEPETQRNIKTLLSLFKEVHACSSGLSCLNKARQLDTITTSCTPTLILIEVALDPGGNQVLDSDGLVSSRVSTQDPEKFRQDSGASSDFSGLALIKHLNADISRRQLSKLALPVAVVPNGKVLINTNIAAQTGDGVVVGIPTFTKSSETGQTDGEHVLRCVTSGAVDVILGEVSSNRIQGLAAQIYRARLEALKDQPTFLEQRRIRKRSWVGVDEEKPYAYLRESMVSTLMESICKPHSAIGAVSSAHTFTIKPEREKTIERAITGWNFSAHSFTDDELLHAAFLMMRHALSMKELEKWRIPADELRNFLLASRSAYNSFVLYHNFRHVVDVLQAIFYFLLQLGALPPHPAAQDTSKSLERSPIAALLAPFDALVLLISAIGHDVGHPGVNNAFLVALKAPLAQLYNDNSVLEAFHCAAYSQILRRYWSVAFEDADVRKLLIKSILATDMQMHFKYMEDLGNLQSKFAHNNNGTDGWDGKQLEEYKVLTCGLLIKCADISNVARPFETASRWAEILQLEFSKQGEMERNVGIPTTLFGGPPELGNVEKLGQSQIGFMNVFAYPLFDAVADILPGMKFGIKEIESNQAIWKQKIEVEKARADAETDFDRSDGFQSPRSGSPDQFHIARSPETSHPEGIPASGSSPRTPIRPPLKTIQGTPDVEAQQSSPIGSVGQAISTPNVLPSQYDRKQSFGLPIIPTGTFNPVGDAGSPFINFSGPDLSDLQTDRSNHLPSPHLPTGSPGHVSAGRPVSSDENIAPSQTPTPNRPATSGASGTGGHSIRRNDNDQPHSPLPSANFSRPMSIRPNHSHTRSSAPSNVPTVPSTAVPNSPTETQATSLLTEGSDAGPDSTEIDRPSSGYSSALATSTASSRSPGRATIIKTTPPGNGIESRSPMANGHGGNESHLRKKSSRFRLDFWKKRRATEASMP